MSKRFTLLLLRFVAIAVMPLGMLGMTVFSGLAAPAEGQLVALQASACAINDGVILSGDTITGTAGNDTIDCTASVTDLTIDGGGGNDSITGGLGDDTLIGRDGNDSITGGPGDDCISGGAGNDTLVGSEGANTIFPGAGENTVDDNTDPGGVTTGCITDPAEGGGTEGTDDRPDNPTPGGQVPAEETPGRRR